MAIGVLVLFVACTVGLMAWLPEWNERAAFGDMLGAVNSLFAGLAFAGVIYAIILQREELALQRRELELTRQELERSAVAQEISAHLLRDQLELLQQSRMDEDHRRRLEARPLFSLKGASYSGGTTDFQLRRLGQQIRDVELTPDPGIKITFNPISLIADEMWFRAALEQHVKHIGFILRYTDIYENRRSERIDYDFTTNSFCTKELVQNASGESQMKQGA